MDSMFTWLRKRASKPKRVISSEAEIDALRNLAEQKLWGVLDIKARKMLAVSPNLHEVSTLLADSLLNQGRLDEALEFALRAAAGNGSGWRPPFIAGIALNKLGRDHEAIDQLKKSIELAPQTPEVLRQLIETVASSEGIKAAATEYIARCEKIGRKPDIIFAEISGIRKWARSVGCHLIEAGEVEEIPFEDPCVQRDSTFKKKHSVKWDKPYVADLPNIQIFSQSNILLTSDGKALSDTGDHPRFGTFVSFTYEHLVLGKNAGEILLDTSDYETRVIEAGILLAGCASGHFGHWFPDYLPRLQFLQHHPDFDSLPIIVDAEMPQTHFDHLRRHVGNPLIYLKPMESFFCRRLLTAMSPSFFPVELNPNNIPTYEMPGISPRAMQFLRGGVGENSSDTPNSGRWFLGRRGMSWRRLINETEIASELSKLGFITVYLEEMGMKDQMEIFRQAEWIVAPNGSALLNLVFSNPSVKLLVLSQPDFFNWGSFQGPMRSLGYNPIWLYDSDADGTGYKHADYQVPVKLVCQMLKTMGLEEFN